MEVTFSMKAAFFDRQAVKDALTKEQRKVISRQLAFIRNTARQQVLRRRKSVSRPGSPPSVRSRSSYASLKNILFAYDASSGGGVVGPVRTEPGSGRAVPGLLEGGGSIATTRKRYIKKARPKKGESKYTVVRRGTIMRYQPRPFMQPALDREIAKGAIAKAWAGVVSG